MHWAFAQPPKYLLVKLIGREDGACTTAAQGKAGADKDRVAPDQIAGNLVCFFQVVRQATARRFKAGFGHRNLKKFAIFGGVHGVKIGPDQFYAILFQNPRLGQPHREVEPRLATNGGQQRVGPLFGNNFFNDIDG